MTAVSIVDFSRAFLEFFRRPEIIVVLAAFFDDSGTHPDSPVVALGGLLGTEAQWNEFGAAWADLLDHPLPGKPPLKQFHLSPLRAMREEFEGYSLAERDRVNYLFRHVILDTGLVTLAAAVDRVAWNKLVVGPIVEEVGKPEELCFVKCVDSVIATCRFRKPNQPSSFASTKVCGLNLKCGRASTSRSPKNILKSRASDSRKYLRCWRSKGPISSQPRPINMPKSG
jgi:hypothetical protein